MSNSTSEAIIAAAANTSDPRFGFPGLRKRDRKSLRQRKREHLFPFTSIVGDVVITTTGDLRAEDLPPSVSIADNPDERLMDAVIDIAESIGVGVGIGTPFPDPRHVSLAAGVTLRSPGIKLQYATLQGFARGLLEIPTVIRVEMCVGDGYYLDADDNMFPYGNCVYEK